MLKRIIFVCIVHHQLQQIVVQNLMHQVDVYNVQED